MGLSGLVETVVAAIASSTTRALTSYIVTGVQVGVAEYGSSTEQNMGTKVLTPVRVQHFECRQEWRSREV